MGKIIVTFIGGSEKSHSSAIRGKLARKTRGVLAWN